MSKTKTPTGLAWGKATKELQDKVKFVLQQAKSNRYSVSRIYAAYNGVFELQEAPQTCSTCLTSRVKRLLEWWGGNAPKEGVQKVTGVAQEADTYESVVAKYKLPIGDALGEAGTAEGEGHVLQAMIEAGQEASGMGINEFALIEGRYSQLVGAATDTALTLVINGKLEALGITKDSSDADTLEAYEALASDTGNAPNEQAFYNAQIEILKREIDAANSEPASRLKPEDISDLTAAPTHHIIDMGEGVLGMHFTPSAEDPAKGTITNADGSKVKAGTYTAADGTVIAVQPVGGKATIK